MMRYTGIITYGLLFSAAWIMFVLVHYTTQDNRKDERAALYPQQRSLGGTPGQPNKTNGAAAKPPGAKTYKKPSQAQPVKTKTPVAKQPVTKVKPNQLAQPVKTKTPVAKQPVTKVKPNQLGAEGSKLKKAIRPPVKQPAAN